MTARKPTLADTTPAVTATPQRNGEAGQSFGAAIWLGILENIFGVSITDKLDSIDIAWEGLQAALATLPPRSVEVLRLRYVEKLTLKDAGKKLGNVTGCRARQIEQKAIRQLRHPLRMKIIKSSIAGHWRLYA